MLHFIQDGHTSYSGRGMQLEYEVWEIEERLKELESEKEKEKEKEREQYEGELRVVLWNTILLLKIWRENNNIA